MIPYQVVFIPGGAVTISWVDGSGNRADAGKLSLDYISNRGDEGGPRTHEADYSYPAGHSHGARGHRIGEYRMDGRRPSYPRSMLHEVRLLGAPALHHEHSHAPPGAAYEPGHAPASHDPRHAPPAGHEPRHAPPASHDLRHAAPTGHEQSHASPAAHEPRNSVGPSQVNVCGQSIATPGHKRKHDQE